jgi:hypothetical protein
LLRQGGSRVILGNLLTVPLEGTFLYVEPVYVQSAGSGAFPELREVATYYNGVVGYQPTLSAALNEAFGASATQVKPGNGGQPSGGNQHAETLAQAIAAAQRAENAAQAALRRGDFAEYGVQERKLQQALNRIASAAAKTKGANAIPVPPTTPTPSATPTSASPTPTPTSSG